MGKFSLTPQKACKEAPKSKSDKDDDDTASRPVQWKHKHTSSEAATRKSSCGCG